MEGHSNYHNENQYDMPDKFSSNVVISTGTDVVWITLTEPDLMREWMGDTEFDITIETDWKINSAIIIRGYHHAKFENTGIVLEFEREKKLKYTHLSNLSRLPDKPENHSVLEFTLTPLDKETHLRLTIENFPTASIRKHLEFYWKNTINQIKKTAESLQG